MKRSPDDGLILSTFGIEKIPERMTVDWLLSFFSVPVLGELAYHLEPAKVLEDLARVRWRLLAQERRALEKMSRVPDHMIPALRYEVRLGRQSLKRLTSSELLLCLVEDRYVRTDRIWTTHLKERVFEVLQQRGLHTLTQDQKRQFYQVVKPSERSVKGMDSLTELILSDDDADQVKEMEKIVERVRAEEALVISFEQRYKSYETVLLRAYEGRLQLDQFLVEGIRSFLDMLSGSIEQREERIKQEVMRVTRLPLIGVVTVPIPPPLRPMTEVMQQVWVATKEKEKSVQVKDIVGHVVPWKRRKRKGIKEMDPKDEKIIGIEVEKALPFSTRVAVPLWEQSMALMHPDHSGYGTVWVHFSGNSEKKHSEILRQEWESEQMALWKKAKILHCPVMWWKILRGESELPSIPLPVEMVKFLNQREKDGLVMVPFRRFAAKDYVALYKELLLCSAAELPVELFSLLFEWIELFMRELEQPIAVTTGLRKEVGSSIDTLPESLFLEAKRRTLGPVPIALMQMKGNTVDPVRDGVSVQKMLYIMVEIESSDLTLVLSRNIPRAKREDAFCASIVLEKVVGPGSVSLRTKFDKKCFRGVCWRLPPLGREIRGKKVWINLVDWRTGQWFGSRLISFEGEKADPGLRFCSLHLLGFEKGSDICDVAVQRDDDERSWLTTSWQMRVGHVTFSEEHMDALGSLW